MVWRSTAYDTWRARAFPAGSKDDALGELHADLALADTWVAETVIPFAERGLWKEPAIDVLGNLGDIERRASELALQLEPSQSQTASEYLDYVRLLATVFAEASNAVK